MPSLSGWALRPFRAAGLEPRGMAVSMPSYRAGLCDQLGFMANTSRVNARVFLCPRYRAGLCDLFEKLNMVAIYFGFLCPRYRAGLCDMQQKLVTTPLPVVS